MADFAKLQALFEQACELPPEQQAAFVDQVSAGDAELHAELSDLLASDEVVKDHTARKAVGDLSTLLQQGQPDALVGAQVGRYTLKSLVGAGGMGSVYLAERNDGVVQQTVAIKFLGRDLLGDGFRQRFEVEREILAKLDHPNITRLIDAEELPDGTPYYVMDYVEGESITRYAFNQQLDVGARLKLFVEVAKAVAHAHQALIVHRDIKPGNILVDAKGEPHLLDFGIAKPLAQLGAQTVSMTVTGQRFFSPQHAAPEQLLGGNITVGCDVYGLGCLLYELLSGEPAIPLTGLTAAEAEKKILHQLPQAPSQRVLAGEKNDERATGFGSATLKSWKKAISGEVDSIVLNCLRKLPHERYRSVDDLIADVQAYQAGMPIAASGGHSWYRAKKFVLRNRWAVTAAALTAIALVSSSVITALQSREATLQRDAAETALVQAKQQRDRAQRVTQFLIDAFAAANPGGELGNSVTAREILQHGALKLETMLDTQPELKAQLLATIAKAQLALSLVDDASKNIELARTLSAETHDQSIAFDVAEASLRVSLEKRDLVRVRERQLELKPLVRSRMQKIAFMELTASALYTDARNAEMISFLEDGLNDIDEVGLDQGYAARIVLLRLRLAAELLWTERKGEVAGLLGELRDSVAELGITDPDSRIDIMRRLSIVYRRSGDHDSAIEAANDAASEAIRIYGESSLKYAITLAAQASILSDDGEYKMALEKTKKIITIYENTYGLESAKLSTIYNNAGIDAVLMGDYKTAVTYYDKSVAIAENKLRRNSSSLYYFRAGRVNALSHTGACKAVSSGAREAMTDFGVREKKSTVANGFLREALDRCGVADVVIIN